MKVQAMLCSGLRSFMRTTKLQTELESEVDIDNLNANRIHKRYTIRLVELESRVMSQSAYARRIKLTKKIAYDSLDEYNTIRYIYVRSKADDDTLALS